MKLYLTDSKRESMKNKNLSTKKYESDNEILSPDISAVYDTEGSVPKVMQLLRKGISEETKSISDYSEFINSGIFDSDDIEKIKEIVNDEKDHIVVWTTMLSKYTKKSYPNNGNESLHKGSINKR